MRRVLIVGATSAIAEATARLFARAGDRIALAGRSPERLTAVADDLRVRGAAQVEELSFDAAAFDTHEQLIEEASRRLGGLDTLLIAHGTLPDQAACTASFEAAREAFEVNAIAVISLLTPVANRFEAQRGGTIAVISSVAGDRGRQSNYVYGAAKGMVSIFLQGLRNRLHPAGVRVVTIKPGFVDTPMTAAFDKGPLWASPERVAEGIHRAIDKGADEVYLPWFWRYIMLVIRHIPEAVFKRMRL